MVQVDDLFSSGTILLLEENSGKGKEKGVRCEGFGWIESWAVSGYEEGTPMIWVSTIIADYNCVKPANGYKSLYSLFLEKANACVQVYQKLSRTPGGGPNLTLEELLARVVRSISTTKTFSLENIREFIVSQGEFIYNQLMGLDNTSKENEQTFRDLPVLTALRDENKKQGNLVPLEDSSYGGNMKISGGQKTNQSSSSSTCGGQEDDMKLAWLLQEEENRQRKQMKTRHSVASSNNFLIVYLFCRLLVC
uniref:RFTS domain-containing protein n=1 Tax=Quercus lobata TaxID=97700 RepID=A0A7N2L3M1_QUELO